MDRSCRSSQLIVELPQRRPVALAVATTLFVAWTLGVGIAVGSWDPDVDIHPAWILTLVPSLVLAELAMRFYEPRFALNEDYLRRKYCSLPEVRGRRDTTPSVARRDLSRRRRSLPSSLGSLGPA